MAYRRTDKVARRLAQRHAAIIHVKTDPEALTSRITLSKLREQSLAKQKH